MNISKKYLKKESARRIFLPVFLAIIVILAWEAFVRLKDIPSALLPPPTEVVLSLINNFAILSNQVGPTALETFASFVISSILGITLAVLICAVKLAREMLYPNIVLFQLIPKIALAPLFIVWLGIGSESRITFSVFVSFFPVVVSTLAGLMSVDRDLLRLCRAVGASPFKTYVAVRFPASVPHLFSGLKIAITFSIIGVIVGEFITAQKGLGYMIMYAASQANVPLVLAAIILLCIIGLSFYGILTVAEKYALKRFGA